MKIATIISTLRRSVALLCLLILSVQAQTCDPNYPYRTFDGTCNNLKNPSYGASGTAFQRLLPATYADGTQAIRLSQSGDALPSPRRVSTAVTIPESLPSYGATQWMMAFGQFLDHDLTRTSPSRLANGSSITCCSGSQTGDFLSSPNSECLPIEIPADDPVFKGVSCMSAVRSRPASNGDGTRMIPREQLNLNTHWIDGSHIYGSNNIDANNLRDPSSGKGKLKVSISDDGREMLPVASTCCPTGACDLAKSCFFAGDNRVREQPLLTVQHTIWVREHNRIAEELVKAFPGRSDEFYFQEARRIVIAEFQHVVYDEWLPVLIGKRLSVEPPRIKNVTENPACYNEFVAAAFRMGHSMVKSFFWLYEADGSRSSLSFFLRDAFSSAGPRAYQPRFIDNAIRGLLQTPVQSVDHCFPEDITSMLFKAADKPFGLDLVALNINRGRDHGLPPYVVARAEALAYLTKSDPPSAAEQFDELFLSHSPEVVASFKQLYNSVRDVDLFIGAVTEQPLPGLLLGPTFASIIARQFQIARINDRFFFTNKKAFSKRQLIEIEKTSMAKILCDNNDGTVNRVQQNVFLPASGLNREVSCQDLPNLDVSVMLSSLISKQEDE